MKNQIKTDFSDRQMTICSLPIVRKKNDQSLNNDHWCDQSATPPTDTQTSPDAQSQHPPTSPDAQSQHQVTSPVV